MEDVLFGLCGENMRSFMAGRVVEWDDDKAALNERKHGISFWQAAHVFEDGFRLEQRDFKHSGFEERYITIGRVDDILAVVCTDRTTGTRIISARLATRAERRMYYGDRQGIRP